MNRIEDYALIGDCETGALVSRSGSIDWLCWPRFDSGACFAALLGGRENGRWLVAPADSAHRVRRRYRDGILILETEFETAEGAATLIDFMPPRDSISDLVRLVVGKRSSCCASTTARSFHGSAASTRARCARSPAPTWSYFAPTFRCAARD
jgi:GH15 family glucan-1,4-alpha-glucosidase